MRPERNDFTLLNQTVIGRAYFKPPYKASQPMHDEARFVHIVSGTSELFVPNGKFSFKAGDSFMMKCENFVNSWIDVGDGQNCEVVIIRFSPILLKHIYQDNIPEIFRGDSVVGNIQPMEKLSLNDMIRHYMASLGYYFNHPDAMTEDLIKIKFKELVHILVQSDKTGRLRTILSNLFSLNAYDFKDIIHSHLFEDLSLQDLAFFTNLSLSSFKRKFKAVYGTSPAHYIKTERLKRAKNLLISTEDRISDIAFDSGFNDLAHFSKAFSAEYHLSPSEYRKQHLS